VLRAVFWGDELLPKGQSIIELWDLRIGKAARRW
jgi:hypothetical protein